MIALRQATPDDIPLLWALRARGRTRLRRSLRARCARRLARRPATARAAAVHRTRRRPGGAVDGSALLGYAVLDLLTGEVDAAFVEPAQHGRGIGRVLLAALEADARAAGIGRLFLSASLNAVPFYQAAGFVALREEVYPHRSGIGIPSVFMEKVLG